MSSRAASVRMRPEGANREILKDDAGATCKASTARNDTVRLGESIRAPNRMPGGKFRHTGKIFPPTVLCGEFMPVQKPVTHILSVCVFAMAQSHSSMASPFNTSCASPVRNASTSLELDSETYHLISALVVHLQRIVHQHRGHP